MMDYQTHEHDVLVIGAGGAGLRAAIEASAAGVSVGLVCKSLLGKAHTVMAEGGIAAALANVDERDNWKVHFADTMRGGQYVNNWRMAQLHAQEAPARVRELEAWGAVFDRTPDGRILQRNFGGHRYPRLAHVGDRTGLELIRTLQDHGIHRGIDVYMECTVVRLLKDGDRVAGAVAYYRDRGRFVVFRAKAVVLATGGIGKAYKITSNSWEYTGDGHTLAYDAGAELQDMEFVQFHPTGMIWPPSVQGILVTEGVRGEGGILLNSKGEQFMYERHSRAVSQPDRQGPRGRLALLPGRPQRQPPGRAADARSRGPLHPARGARGRGSPHGGVFLDIAWIKAQDPQRRRAHQAEAAEHVSPVQGAGRHRHHQGADGSRPDHPLHHGRRARRRRDADVAGAGAVRLRRVRRRHQRGQSAGRQLALRPARVRQAGRRVRGQLCAGTMPAPAIRADQVEAATAWALAPFEQRGREGPFQIQQDLQDDDAGPGRHRPARGRNAARPGGAGRPAPAGRAGQGDGQPRIQSRLAHGARPAQPAHGLRSDHSLRL